jgi:hypothetical protein
MCFKGARRQFDCRLGHCGIDRRRADVLRVTCLPLQCNLRSALRECATNLIVDCGHCSTNRRCTIFDTCLLFDAPHGHPSYRLHSEARQDLAITLYLHKQHTKTEHIVKLTISKKPINYIYQSNITQIVSFRPQSVSINYYTKSHCHL